DADAFFLGREDHGAAGIAGVGPVNESVEAGIGQIAKDLHAGALEGVESLCAPVGGVAGASCTICHRGICLLCSLHHRAALAGAGLVWTVAVWPATSLMLGGTGPGAGRTRPRSGRGS